MIKNILKLKLFVLCSMLFCSLVVSVFCFGTFSKAAPSQSDMDEMTSDLNQRFGISPNQNLISDICDFWDNNHDTYPYLLLRYFSYGSGYVGTSLFMKNNPTITGGNTYNIKSDCRCPVVMNNAIDVNPMAYENFYARNSLSLQNNTYYSVTCATSQAILYSYEDFHTDDVDWNNPFYSANIQSPNVNITYREFTSVPTIDVPLNVSFLNDLENYYFESFAIFCQPETVMVTVENGQYVYDGFDYQNIWRPLVNMQDLQKPSDYSVDSFHLLMNDAWYNSRLTDGMIDFIYPTGFSANSQTNASSKYNNLRKNQCMACNQIYLYFRYFTVIDGQVVVGPWRIWSSYDPSVTTEEIPEYIQPYLPAVGTTGTTTDINPVSTSSPEPTQIYNPSSTGSNVNITVSQNVPNYPDYPTIASYNKDNLLVDTMNQLTSMEGFFGEFGSFLTTAFAFMPAWIWAIIGVGFSLSIVVMFLKIL